MYHQFIETPSCKGHSWPGFSHLEDRRIPTFIFVHPQGLPGLGLPTKNWAQTLWVDLLPSKKLRVPKSLWGWTPKWLTKCHPVNCHHILDVGDKCRTGGIHKKSDLSVMTRKSSICFWDYTISNLCNWRHAYHVSQSKPSEPITL